MNFKHFILSRFNCNNIEVANEERALKKLKEFQLSSQWMEDRINLMKRYTIPSIENQTNKNFEWILFVHTKTPQYVIDELRKFPCEILITDNDSISAANRIRDKVWVLTTNLDTDDGLAKNYVEKTQFLFEPTTTVISYNRGIAFRESTHNFFMIKIENNAYQTLVESGQEPKTIFTTNHLSLHKIFPVNRISTTTPMWLQVIHGKNISNTCIKKTKKDLPLERDYVSKYFNIKGVEEWEKL